MSQDPRTPATAEPPAKRKRRVLCVEDDKHVAIMLEVALKTVGYHVDHAADGREALDRLKSDLSSFDVLITDNDMPNLSGLALVEKLRALGFAGGIIVHCSPLDERATASYRQLRIDHIFEKPVRLVQLLAAVKEAAHRSS